MIRTIIFDLGGVVLPINPDNTVKEFEKLGLKNFNKIYTLKKQEHFFDEFEKGKISAIAFRNEIKKHYTKTVTDDQIDFAWNALIGELTPERFSFLAELKTKYNLFLLSNTNIIHHTCFTKTSICLLLDLRGTPFTICGANCGALTIILSRISSIKVSLLGSQIIFFVDTTPSVPISYSNVTV